MRNNIIQQVIAPYHGLIQPTMYLALCPEHGLYMISMFWSSFTSKFDWQGLDPIGWEIVESSTMF